MKEKIRQILVKNSDNKNANDRIEAELLDLFSVSFSLRDKFAMEAMNGELASQGGVDGCVWANEVELAERAYLVADAMIKARSNES
jgi:hypothetical protein